MQIRFFPIALVMLAAATVAATAATGKRPPPPGTVEGAPSEFTQFTTAELMRGFLALAFGSDLSIGAQSKGIRRFDRVIRAKVVAGGAVNRKAEMESIIAEYASKIPNLQIVVVSGSEPADITVRLIDEKDFAAAIENAFGRDIAREFVAKTDPQCMTSVRSDGDGAIEQAVSFVIVDQGADVFFDCAYHELMHAVGLSNHDDKNPWTMLNQERTVGYLTVYDRALLTLLYDPRIEPGLTPAEVKAMLPKLIRELGLAADVKPAR